MKENNDLSDFFAKKVRFGVTTEMTIESLSHLVISVVRDDDMPKFIALLDADCENWDVTEKLIKHYKHLEQIYIKEEIDVDEKLEPKNIFENED